MGRRRGAFAAAGLGLPALLLLVGLASRPDGAGAGLPASEDAARVALDSAFYLLCALGVLGLLLAIWALWPDPDLESPRIERPGHRSLLAVTALSLLTVLAVWSQRGRLARLPLPLQPAPAGPRGGAVALPGSAGGAAAGVDWVAIGIVAALLALGGLLLWRALFRTPPPRHRVPPPRARLAAILDDAIEDVLAEKDPRRAVIAAWARVERVLAGHGAGRRPAEAPLEYAVRAPAAAGLPAPPMARLATLYEWARFSVHEVSPAMREEALSGLVAVRDGVRGEP